MKLLIHATTREILDASNTGDWQVPAFAEVLDVVGDAESFAWPSGEAARCRLTVAGLVEAIPGVPTKQDADDAAVLDSTLALKAVVLWVAGKLSIAPATARAEILAIYRSLKS